MRRAGTRVARALWTRRSWQACWLAAALGLSGGLQAQTSSGAVPAPAPTRVTVVLAGGGAKGFAHLAVLRRLEQDNIRIARIVGTSMGAVIGGLYAGGLSTQDIEKVIGNLDPGKVALDQVDRTELPHRTRSYQQQYPVEVELGVKNGQLTFARGVSDGQRFLTLLQELTAHVPPKVRFDDLRVPFRAVATRYRDGELVAFDQGNLALAIRASMAAPGVFAPVEIDGETYVDGGLVANLPVEVALREGADVIVASYLGDTERFGASTEAGNALTVANQMLTILMRQNERRNLAALRPQDIVVRPQMQDFGFVDFNLASDIVKAGAQAVALQEPRFAQLSRSAEKNMLQAATPRLAFSEREIRIARIDVTGNKDVSDTFIRQALRSLEGREYRAREVGESIDDLYASGHFERINYQLAQISNSDYALVVDVNEKTYGPHFLKTSLGFFAESGGTNMFSMGLGYRRPWLTASGLELNIDAIAGSQTTLASSVFQPLSGGWGLDAFAQYRSGELPLYRPDNSTAEKMALSTLRRQEVGVNLTYDFSKKFTAKIGLSANNASITINTAKDLSYTTAGGSTVQYHLQDVRGQFSGVSAQFNADLLDSPSFPTRGYYLDIHAAQGITAGSPISSYRLHALWARSFGPHVFNFGLDVGSEHIFDCDGCTRNATVAPLFLGGFQDMGAYQFGQLNGDRLAHVQSTYMYRLSEGGIFRQPTYIGFVAEAGDAWMHTESMSHNYSGTLFVAVDSKIGDIFFGIASGSGNNRNIFLQLGRRFTIW